MLRDLKLPLVLGLVAAASSTCSSADIGLSGTVQTKNGNPFPGLVVSLPTAGISDTTDAKGAWALSSAGIRIHRKASLPLKNNHLVWQEGRLHVQFGESDASGRTLGLNQETTQRSAPESASRTLATSVDTLTYSFHNRMLLREIISGFVQSDIFRQLDTIGSTIPWQGGIAYGWLLDSRDGQRYRTVRIGFQNWMAENLNFAGDSGKLGGCYGECSVYGRLYGWPDVMAGDVYNKNLPNRRIQGICPKGWHVPSVSAWQILNTTVDPSETNSGARLKALEGWDSAGNGTDVFGFRALPAGERHYYKPIFYSLGITGAWWTSQGQTEPVSDAYLTAMGWNSQSLENTHTTASSWHSLRCIDDSTDGVAVNAHDSTLSSLNVIGGGTLTPAFDKNITQYYDTIDSSVNFVFVKAIAADTTNKIQYESEGYTNYVGTTTDTLTLNKGAAYVNVLVKNINGNGIYYTVNFIRHQVPGIPWQANVTYGSVNDLAGKSYRTVSIGSQTWMAENLNYSGPLDSMVGVCSGGSADSCLKYGRLYNWAEAMKATSSTLANSGPVQGICPIGWHVPSDADWLILQTQADPNYVTDGRSLKSNLGWINNSVGGIGSDAFGFRALPGGNQITGASSGAGYFGTWWTSNESDIQTAMGRAIYYNNDAVIRGGSAKTNSYSLRCIKN